MSHIHAAAVLGAGTMGAQIAAHMANAGLSVWLLDLTAATAAAGLRTAERRKPSPFFTPETARRISTGGFDTDLDHLRACDWIIEAVSEQLDIKRALLARIEAVRGETAIVSSTTSGLPIAAMADGCSTAFQRHWLGTHFFNPPRYMQLLEVVPTPLTAPDVVERIASFADRALGKGVVIAKDTPSFIANRIGVHGALQTVRLWAGGTYTIEEIDAITGPAIGRARSGTFRTLDLAGIDILAHVARHLLDQLDTPDEHAAFALPPVVDQLLERGWIGDKAGQGFYKRLRETADRRTLVLDPLTMDYRDWAAPQLPTLDAAGKIDHLPDRLRALFLGTDRVGAFLRATLGRTLLYAAAVAPDIAHTVEDVDRAMRWGFGWEIGPFEIWDAVGVEAVLEACAATDPPPLIQRLRPDARRFHVGGLPPAGPDLQIVRQARDAGAVVRAGAEASLVDIGDGVLAVAFHSKMNVLGDETIAMLQAGVAEAERHFGALVIGNDSPVFSAGANLRLLLQASQAADWDTIDKMVRTFQQTVLGLRTAAVPVVAAPRGLTLGGGCEVTLHTDRVQAAAETYMGQVEVGVGLIPAGGGTKELLARCLAARPAGVDELGPSVRQAFDLIAFATVSASARDAQRLGLLRAEDGITMNAERMLSDAKEMALGLARGNYHPPPPRRITVGGPDLRAVLNLGVHLARRGGHISDHDAIIGRTLAAILTGGDIPHPSTVSEQYLLDLEREAFLRLCGEPKTQARIAHTLKTGKPLRN